MHGLELALLGFAALLGVAGFVLIVLIALVLSKRRLADLRAMADAKGVSWSAVEDAFGGPLEGRPLPGADAGAVEATVADTISALAKGAE